MTTGLGMLSGLEVAVILALLAAIVIPVGIGLIVIFRAARRP